MDHLKSFLFLFLCVLVSLQLNALERNGSSNEITSTKEVPIPDQLVAHMVVLEGMNHLNSIVHHALLDPANRDEAPEDWKNVLNKYSTVKFDGFNYKSLYQRYQKLDGETFLNYCTEDFKLSALLQAPFAWEGISIGNSQEVDDGFQITVLGYVSLGLSVEGEGQAMRPEAHPFEIIWEVEPTQSNWTCQVLEFSIDPKLEPVLKEKQFADTLVLLTLPTLFAEPVVKGQLAPDRLENLKRSLRGNHMRWEQLRAVMSDRDLSMKDAAYTIFTDQLHLAQLAESLPSFTPSMQPFNSSVQLDGLTAEAAQMFSLFDDFPPKVQQLLKESEWQSDLVTLRFARLWHYLLLDEPNDAFFARDVQALNAMLPATSYSSFASALQALQRCNYEEAIEHRERFIELSQCASAMRLLEKQYASTWLATGQNALQALNAHYTAFLFPLEKGELDKVAQVVSRSSSWPSKVKIQEEQLHKTPSNKTYWSDLAFARAQNGQDPKLYLDRSFTLTGVKTPKDFTTEAVYLDRNGRNREALAKLKEGNAAWAENTWIYKGYALVSKKASKALKYGDKAADLETTDRTKSNFLKGESRFMLLGDSLLNLKKKMKLAAQASGYYQLASKGEYENPAHFRMAQCYTLMGAFGRAEEKLNALANDSIGTLELQFYQCVLGFLENDVVAFRENLKMVEFEMRRYAEINEGKEESGVILFFSGLQRLYGVLEQLNSAELSDADRKKAEGELTEMELHIRRLEGFANNDAQAYARWLRVYKEILTRKVNSAPGDDYYKQANPGIDGLVKEMSATAVDPYYFRNNAIIRAFSEENKLLFTAMQRLPAKSSGLLQGHFFSPIYFGPTFTFD